jgi:hypothetical protein
MSAAVPPQHWDIGGSGVSVNGQTGERDEDHVIDEECLSIKSEAQLKHLSYRILLCRYTSGDYSGVSTLIERQLEALTPNGDALFDCQPTDFGSVYYGRLISLLMCAEFKQGNFIRAMRAFDISMEIYSYFLGPMHPIIGAHFGCLADLYHDQGERGLSHTQAMITLAYEHSLASVGFSHRFTLGYANKLGMLYLRENKLDLAEKIMSASLDALEQTAQLALPDADGLESVETDLAVSLYALAVCSYRRNNLPQTVLQASRALTLLRPTTAQTIGHNPSTLDWGAPIREVEHSLLILLVGAQISHPSAVTSILQNVWVQIKPGVDVTAFFTWLQARGKSQFQDGRQEGAGLVTDADTVPVDAMEFAYEVLAMLLCAHMYGLSPALRHFVDTSSSHALARCSTEIWNKVAKASLERVWKLPSPATAFDEVVTQAGVYHAPGAEPDNADLDEVAVAFFYKLCGLGRVCADGHMVKVPLSAANPRTKDVLQASKESKNNKH